ncbi:unnamed protein product [Urochloa decumbens]|uniref:Uncharacterized protein n=1 Tax=Urochloa decumbens TaxID=240449 RepID=A0ABC9AG59_9POAL
MATQQQLSTINSNNQVGIDIPGPEEHINAAAQELVGGNPRQLARPLLLIGSWTLVGVFNRIVCKLPPGAIFEGNLIAYYLTLFGVFLAGVAEVYSAILLSSAQDGGRVRAIAAPLLCASVVLLTALVTFGGSPVPVMG